MYDKPRPLPAKLPPSDSSPQSGQSVPALDHHALANACFIQLVRAEVRRVETIHGPILNRHHAYGILAEEVAEFFDEVRKKKSNPEDLLSELVQIAAVASRAATALALDKLSAMELAIAIGKAQAAAR